jgi:hypothetical protein
MISYDGLLQRTQGQNNNLLLGNGFSIAYSSERFSFTSLLDSAIDKNIIDKDSNIYNIFKKNNTSDFEEVIKLLGNYMQILNLYHPHTDTESEEQDCDNIKKHLIDIITNNHPKKPDEITQQQYINTINFISKYNNIFSLNYDLLLYWTILKMQEYIDHNILDTQIFKSDDGFRSKEDEYLVDARDIIFDKDKKITLNYLHGGLHIYDNGYNIKKITYDNGILKDQILQNLNNNKYPIFVSEGESKDKLTKILHNQYLNKCYQNLENINGNLILFGTTLKTNDEHIIKNILNNQAIEKIYIGISNNNQELEINTRFNNDNKIVFYNRNDINIW